MSSQLVIWLEKFAQFASDWNFSQLLSVTIFFKKTFVCVRGGEVTVTWPRWQLTCLPTRVVCSDDLFLGFVPGDLHHHIAVGRLVAAGQDGLIFCQGAYGILHREIQKASLYLWN